MALYLGRDPAGHGGRKLRRVTLEWEDGELVLEPEHDGSVRLRVTVGSRHEEHRLDLDHPERHAITSESQLIRIEEIGKAGALAAPEAKKSHTTVNAHSKLIKIEETGASLPEVTVLLPGPTE